MTQTPNGPVELLQQLLGHIEAQTFDGLAKIVHPDAVFEFPYSAAKPIVTGGAACVDYLRTAVGPKFASFKFDVQTWRACADPDVVVAEYTSEALLRAGGAYRNRYISVLEVRDGRIVLFREFFNPLALVTTG